MKRDITVWLSLAMIVLPGIAGLAMGMPRDITSDDPWLFHAFFWLILLGIIRGIALWFQTLIHGMNHARAENRGAVVIGHLCLSLLMAYGYYLAARLDDGTTSNGSHPPPNETDD